MLRKLHFVGKVVRGGQVPGDRGLFVFITHIYLLYSHLSDLLINNLLSCGFHLCLCENRYICVKAFNQRSVNKMHAFDTQFQKSVKNRLEQG